MHIENTTDDTVTYRAEEDEPSGAPRERKVCKAEKIKKEKKKIMCTEAGEEWTVTVQRGSKEYVKSRVHGKNGDLVFEKCKEGSGDSHQLRHRNETSCA